MNQKSIRTSASFKRSPFAFRRIRESAKDEREVWSRVRKAKKGIDKAIKRGEAFHMWFHPCTLSYDTERLLDGLEDIFAYVREKIDRGLLLNSTMKEVYKRTQNKGWCINDGKYGPADSG
ncbi:MAG: hypothetical protein GX854_07975 [Clostridiales bacterium]|nr:hypothetical protein [Clostridiales bacterium]